MRSASTLIPERTGKQCRVRFEQSLKKKKSWAQDEVAAETFEIDTN